MDAAVRELVALLDERPVPKFGDWRLDIVRELSLGRHVLVLVRTAPDDPDRSERDQLIDAMRDFLEFMGMLDMAEDNYEDCYSDVFVRDKVTDRVAMFRSARLYEMFRDFTGEVIWT